VTDFAANVHFRALAPLGVAGGYGWFLGRYADWPAFEGEIKRHLPELGYYYVECLTLIELASEDDLNDGEQRELYRQLAVRPIQWGTLHTYQHDDA
jgi:hypothetical protein